jgi:ubiquinone/menaquinone biosynthesis C-methylase UbiE
MASRSETRTITDEIGMGKNIESNFIYDGHVDPEFYNQYVEKFGSSIHTASLISIVRGKISLFQENGSPSRILEFAAGTGRNSIQLSKFGYKVSASDLSHDMLKFLEKEESNITIFPGEDMNEKFNFPDNSFEGVTTMWANRFIKDIQRTVKEVNRILVPEGTFIWPVFSERSCWEKNNFHGNPFDPPQKLVKTLTDAGFINIELIQESDALQGSFEKPRYYFTYLVAKKAKDSDLDG